MPDPKIHSTYRLELITHQMDAAKRWFISFYQLDPKTKKRKRHRVSFGMNKIPDAQQRYRFAIEKIQVLENLLPLGYPYQVNGEIIEQGAHGRTVHQDPGISLHSAIIQARDIKIRSGRPKSANVYRNISGVFLKYLQDHGLGFRPVDHFTRSEAMRFLDHIVIYRRISMRTRNNYLTVLRSFFTELVDRNLIEKNPFSGIREKPNEQKIRRAFTNEEQRIVMAEIAKRDRTLQLAVLLIFYCFIRPTELRRLRFQFFDLEKSVIRLPGAVTKNKKSAIVTLPDRLIPMLEDFGFRRYHPNMLIFGRHGRPHHSVAIGEHTLNRRHGLILQDLKKRGKLQDITGLSLYSWKDSGAMHMIEAGLSIIELRDQIRHQDLSITQLYLNQLSQVNEKIRALDGGLISVE